MARTTESTFRTMSRTRPGFALYRNANGVYIPPTKTLFAERINFGERIVLVESWQRLPQVNASVGIAANPDFEVLGTNVATATIGFDPEGGVKVTTAGASGDQVIILPHLDTGQSAWAGITWGTDRETKFSEIIKTGSAVTAQIIWCGLKLTNTPTAGTDNDEVFVRYEAGVSSGKFVVHWAIDNVNSSTVTDITVAADTVYDITIDIDENRRARVYINGSLVATTGILKDATDLKPYLGIEASAVAAKSLTTRKRVISRKAA